jgi:hypothetical protein
VNPEAEESVRRRLAKGDLSDASQAISDSSCEGFLPSLIDVEGVEINDPFLAGHRVAFRVSLHGTYRGGCAGIGDEAIGASATLRCAGIASVQGGAVTQLWAYRQGGGARRAGAAISDHPLGRPSLCNCPMLGPADADRQNRPRFPHPRY